MRPRPFPAPPPRKPNRTDRTCATFASSPVARRLDLATRRGQEVVLPKAAPVDTVEVGQRRAVEENLDPGWPPGSRARCGSGPRWVLADSDPVDLDLSGDVVDDLPRHLLRGAANPIIVVDIELAARKDDSHATERPCLPDEVSDGVEVRGIRPDARLTASNSSMTSKDDRSSAAAASAPAGETSRPQACPELNGGGEGIPGVAVPNLGIRREGSRARVQVKVL